MEEIILNYSGASYGIVQELVCTPAIISNSLLTIAFYAAIITLVATMLLMKRSVRYTTKKNIFGKERRVVDIQFNLDWIKENKDQFIKVHLFILIMLCQSWIINHLAVVIWGIGI